MTLQGHCLAGGRPPGFEPVLQAWRVHGYHRVRIHDYPSCDGSKIMRGRIGKLDGLHCGSYYTTNKENWGGERETHPVHKE